MNPPSWAPLSQIAAPREAAPLGGVVTTRLVEEMPVAVVTLDGSARLLYVNKEAARLLGRRREALIGRVFTGMQPKSNDRDKLAAALQSALGGAMTRLPLRIEHGEDSTRLVNAHVMPGALPGRVDVVLLDLTEQHEVEAALYQSETLYDTFLEQSPIGLVHLDAAGTITFENHRFRMIVGERPEDSWTGLNAFSIPGLDGLFSSAVKRLLNARLVQDFGVRYSPPGSPMRHLVMNGSPIRREDGSVSGAVLMVQDVTEERARAVAHALRERFSRAEATLRELVLTDPQEASFLRETARIFAQTMGADRAAILMPCVLQESVLLARGAWGEKSDALASLRVDLSAEKALGAISRQQTPLFLPGLPGNPDYRLTEARRTLLVPFMSEGHFEGLILLDRFDGDALLTPGNEEPLAHLTRLFETLWMGLRTTHRYRLTVSTIEDGLVNFVFEPDGRRRFLFLTPQVERITGLAPQAYLEHPERWQELALDSAARDTLARHDSRLQHGEESEVVFPARLRGSGSYWLRERGIPHRDEAGELSVISIVSDVTEQKRAEQVLLDAKADAETASRDKTAFIATLSHEIRTPLGTVNGFAELLSRELDEYAQQTGVPLTPQIEEFIATIRDRTEQTLALVSDIFDLANLEAGSVHLNRTETRVNDLATEVASRYAPLLSEKKVALHLDLDPRDPRVVADADRLEQILDNLLSNAVKFTAEGSVGLRTRQDEATVVIEVADTGVGMSEAFQERLFTPFVQEDQRLNRDFAGMGLGLSLVKRLVDLLGGDVSVASRKGEGSTFRVSLPALALS